MIKEKILERQKNAEDILITEYLSKDGYVWKMIMKAMQEYADVRVKEERDVIRLMLLDEDLEMLAEKI